MAAILAALALLSACGGEAYRESEVEDEDSGTTADTSTGTTTETTTSTTTTTTDPDYPTYSFSFSITGSQGTTPTYESGSISTDNVLRVKVTPGEAGPLSLTSGSSNFSATYYCVSYKVTVLGKSVTTQPLKLGEGGPICPDAEESEIIDFSDRLTTGHGDVTIEVSSPRYDFYCQMLYLGYIWSGYYNTYCSTSLYPVYKNHTVTGSLEVEVNGTSL